MILCCPDISFSFKLRETFCMAGKEEGNWILFFLDLKYFAVVT